MSRSWSSCAVETICGSCRGAIRFGHPMQTITPHPERASAARFIRCRLCADGEPPSDLPAPVVNRGAPILPSVLVRSGPNTLPFDFKQHAAADRSPGDTD